MRRLRIAAKPSQDAAEISVHWTIDDTESPNDPWQGVCTVAIPVNLPFGPEVAELHALDFLLTERRIFGPQTVPYNCRVTMSCQDAIDLISERSSNLRLIPFGRFLFFTMNEEALEFDNDTAWTSFLRINPERVYVVQFKDSISRHVELELIGKVRITRHAAIRFAERYCLPRGEPAAPQIIIKKIKKLLSHPSVNKVLLSPDSKLNKILNHFREAAIYARPDLNVAFVVAVEAGELYMPTVVTWEAWRNLTPSPA